MKVVIIEEDNHGYIGVASTMEKAIQYLISSHWIEENTEFYSKEDKIWKTVVEFFGKDWEEKIIHQPAEFFDGCFYFTDDTLEM